MQVLTSHEKPLAISREQGALEMDLKWGGHRSHELQGMHPSPFPYKKIWQTLRLMQFSIAFTCLRCFLISAEKKSGAAMARAVLRL